LRLAFMGTPDFAVPTLAALINGGHEIVAVYTQPPRPAGRGKKLRPTPVQTFAELKGIPVFSPASLKDAGEQAAFKNLGLDAAVVVAYGLILPPAILAAPRLGCINVHASLLPRWRGAAPIQRAIMAGDKETGVSIMQMDKGLDTGPVILERRTAIAQGDTAGSLHDRLSELGAEVICDALEGLQSRRVKPTPQPERGVTYAEKISKQEGHINWNQPARDVGSQIRGLTPFPGAWFEFSGNRVKVLEVELHNSSQDRIPGQIIAAPLIVACLSGALELITLQREGKSAMTADQLLRGFPIPPASKLG
jgi:methionyl-tRNA formyltransferase